MAFNKWRRGITTLILRHYYNRIIKVVTPPKISQIVAKNDESPKIS